MLFDQTVDTKLTQGELIRRIHGSTEYLNKYIRQYNSISDPIQKVTALTHIVRERLRFQVLEKKLTKAYLDAVDRNIREISTWVLRNPQYLPQLDSIREQIEKILKWAIEEESRGRAKAHYLRKDARNLLDKVKPTFKSVRRNIEKSQKKMAKKQEKPPAHELGGPLPYDTKKRLEQWNRLQQLKKQKELAGKK